jgi:hypothetical protein
MIEKDSKTVGVVISSFLLGLIIVLIAIFFQFEKLNEAKKFELTYRINDKMAQWEKNNPEAKKWIYNLHDTTSLTKNFEKWNFDDYLAYYEDLNSLWTKGLVDKQLAYDCFSWNVESIYERNGAELRKIISKERAESNDPELYIGIEFLYYEFMKGRKTISGEHKIVPKD